jgi:hypothetical protein
VARDLDGVGGVRPEPDEVGDPRAAVGLDGNRRGHLPGLVKGARGDLSRAEGRPAELDGLGLDGEDLEASRRDHEPKTWTRRSELTLFLSAP